MRHTLVVILPVFALACGSGREHAPGRSASGPQRSRPAAASDTGREVLPAGAPAVLSADTNPSTTPQGSPSTSTEDAIPGAADSVLVVVDRPTLVGYFAITQAQVDSEGGDDEALSDFQYYLPLARDSLAKLGVTLRVQYRDTIVYRVADVIKRWFPPTDSAAVGYVLLRPTAPPRVAYGVVTHDDLLQRVAAWLRDTAEAAKARRSRPAP